MATTKGKDAILRRIENEKVCSRARLTCFCGVSAVELDAAAKELEAEGKIKAWPKGRSCLYTLPGAPDPRGPQKDAAPEKANDAAKRSEKPRRVNRTPATPADAGAYPPIGAPPAAETSDESPPCVIVRLRPTTWLDLNMMRPVFGIQAKHDGRWMNCSEDGIPLLFESEAERDNWLRERRAASA